MGIGASGIIRFFDAKYFEYKLLAQLLLQRTVRLEELVEASFVLNMQVRKSADACLASCPFPEKPRTINVWNVCACETKRDPYT